MLYLFDFENGLFYSCSACETANRAINNVVFFLVTNQVYQPRVCDNVDAYNRAHKCAQECACKRARKCVRILLAISAFESALKRQYHY